MSMASSMLEAKVELPKKKKTKPKSKAKKKKPHRRSFWDWF